jgi:peptidoglycan/xylan/chitin deacetylase (PgdA/CDA1 family)
VRCPLGVLRGTAAGAAILLAAGCGVLRFPREAPPPAPSPTATNLDEPGLREPPSRGEPPRPVGRQPAPLSQTFESEDFVVTFAKPGDTAASLAARFLGDPDKAWMIEDYNPAAALPAPGQPVVIPKQPWNLAGVEPSGYQLVPVLVYHNLASQARGRLVIAAKSFEEQMRYLKTHDYRVVHLRQLYEFISLRRQLPRKAVVLTFDDGYRSFLDHAYPVLKQLGFTATLFVYTDYVGAGRNALRWEDLRRLQQEGFDIQGHSKTHGDLRRKAGESDADYSARMKLELGDPQALFERHLGRRADILAYPYGFQDDDLLQKVVQYGYGAAFTVRREGNPAFVYPLRAHRSQIYAEMTLEDFAKSLNTFNSEPIR